MDNDTNSLPPNTATPDTASATPPPEPSFQYLEQAMSYAKERLQSARADNKEIELISDLDQEEMWDQIRQLPKLLGSLLGCIHQLYPSGQLSVSDEFWEGYEGSDMTYTCYAL